MKAETASAHLEPDNVRTLIATLKGRVLAGGEITPDEALQLQAIEDRGLIDELLDAAHAITLHFNSDEPGLCSLVNAKSNLCGEDCKFCSQSVRYDTSVDRYKLMSVDEVVKVGKEFEKTGTRNFCIVTSGGELDEREFEQVIEMFERLGEETNMNLDGSLGFVTPERARRLKVAGLRRFNSNLQTSGDYYSQIVSTHTHEKRVETLKVLLEQGLEICSGGILGMGESREDRVKMAFELKPFAPHCLPMNILNPREGTPLEDQPREDPYELVKTIAVYRFVHPRSNIKLAGGREVNLGDQFQQKSLMGGANGLIIGGYLTTDGNPVQRDMDMLERAGFAPASPKDGSES